MSELVTLVALIDTKSQAFPFHAPAGGRGAQTLAPLSIPRALTRDPTRPLSVMILGIFTAAQKKLTLHTQVQKIMPRIMTSTMRNKWGGAILLLALSHVTIIVAQRRPPWTQSVLKQCRE